MNKEDRRIRKTKKALRETFAELLMQKSIQHITVKELTDKADVHRSTFYANFKDIYDLYNHTEDIVMQEISDAFATEYSLDTKVFFNALLQYISDNKQICRLILSNNANSTFLNRISNLFKDLCIECWQKEFNLSCTSKELEVYAHFSFSGNLGIISKWIADDSKDSKEEIMEVLADIDYGFGEFIKRKFHAT
ncbi:MAG: TetR/AcrR family transcriptional regulator [Defluviitaleaceae bacterium]|nr:TetR/AcrR family transcriptional regulator [Defluviitaleaceae bacterium]